MPTCSVGGFSTATKASRFYWWFQYCNKGFKVLLVVSVLQQRLQGSVGGFRTATKASRFCWCFSTATKASSSREAWTTTWKPPTTWTSPSARGWRNATCASRPAPPCATWQPWRAGLQGWSRKGATASLATAPPFRQPPVQVGIVRQLCAVGLKSVF